MYMHLVREFYYNVILGKDSEGTLLKGNRLYFIGLWLDDVRCVATHIIKYGVKK